MEWGGMDETHALARSFLSYSRPLGRQQAALGLQLKDGFIGVRDLAGGAV